jgi:FAD/FMN-containing dehydrogenase
VTSPAPAVDLDAFAQQVAGEDPVACVGGRTRWDVGGRLAPGCREVAAPAGITAYEPADMTVVCGAGTTVAELAEVLAARGQMVPLDPPNPRQSTVGGVLAVGRSGHRRLRYGHLRDLLLAARMVMADGTTVAAGGPTVKNVSGYDLHKLQVGALGTLGFLGEVRLRCLPLPAAAEWFTTGADPFELWRLLYRPSSLLWDGATTWVLLEGHADDVQDQAAGNGLAAAECPPLLPSAGRASYRPSDLASRCALLEPGSFVAEIGVGVVHLAQPVAEARAEPAGLDLHERLKQAFDRCGRLNPGRRPW